MRKHERGNREIRDIKAVAVMSQHYAIVSKKGCKNGDTRRRNEVRCQLNKITE